MRLKVSERSLKAAAIENHAVDITACHFLRFDSFGGRAKLEQSSAFRVVSCLGHKIACLD